MDTKLQNPTAPREPWRLEERRILAANAYRVDWWHTYPTREAALAEFVAVLRKAERGFYDGWDPDADHRLLLVEDGAK